MSSYRLSCATSALYSEPVRSPEAEELVSQALALLHKAIEQEKAFEQAETEAEEAEEAAEAKENPWELYSSTPGWADASAEISKAVDNACVRIGRISTEAEAGTWLETADQVWEEDISPILQKFAEFGATDSEPVYTTRVALETAAKAVLRG